jgi:hypothetical protein
MRSIALGSKMTLAEYRAEKSLGRTTDADVAALVEILEQRNDNA